jgi:serine/threonine protein kinase
MLTSVGRHRIVAELGHSALGAILLAEDPLLGRKVVIALPEKESCSAEIRQRFLQTAKILGALRHPNVLTLHEAGEVDGRPYLVSEFIEGQTLESLSHAGNGLMLAVVMRVVSAIAGAVEYLHEKGVAHRDIRPANIVIRPTGDPTLAYFGLATSLASAPADPPRIPVGTPGYLSPEQARCEPATARTDIWGLGATLFSAILRRPPVSGSTPQEVLARTASADPIDLTELRKCAPDYVADIVQLCLGKDPATRYPSAAALKRALDAAVDHLDAPQRPTQLVAAPRAGQIVLLHVEYQDAGQPGAFREYAIESELNEGAFGKVYGARELLSGREVALKILKPQWLADPDTIDRFRREALLLSRLSHPNVVRLYTFGRFAPTFFLSMEWLKGPTLADVLQEKGPMKVQEAIHYVRQILTGLSAVHAAGAIHRDLKPENAKITADGRVVLFDFGLAYVQQAARLTMSGTFLGTPAYAAPEQVMNLPTLPETDVYAAGVILYELLSGKLPFEADTIYALMTKVANEQPRPITDHRKDLPADLVKTIQRMMRRNPAQRLSVAQALALLTEA